MAFCCLIQYDKLFWTSDMLELSTFIAPITFHFLMQKVARGDAHERCNKLFAITDTLSYIMAKLNLHFMLDKIRVRDGGLEDCLPNTDG